MGKENQEYKAWLERTEKDIKAAKNSLVSGDYEWACFQAHQAAEKALKAAYIKKYNELLKTHDLVLLAKKIGAEQPTVEHCTKLGAVYVESRYPDKPAEYGEEDANGFIKNAEEIIQWIKKVL